MTGPEIDDWWLRTVSGCWSPLVWRNWLPATHLMASERLEEATGQRRRFSSAILPAWARKSPGVAEVLPLLDLHGLSTGDFVPALEQFLGSTAGLSAATVNRLTVQWREDAEAFAQRSLT